MFHVVGRKVFFSVRCSKSLHNRQCSALNHRRALPRARDVLAGTKTQPIKSESLSKLFTDKGQSGDLNVPVNNHWSLNIVSISWKLELYIFLQMISILSLSQASIED